MARNMQQSFASSQDNKSFQSQLDNNYSNTSQMIQRVLIERKKMLEGLRIKIESQSSVYLSTNRKNEIIKDCTKYGRLGPIFKEVKQCKGKGDRMSKFENFWLENQKLQLKLEQQLKQLKKIDIHIDNIVNEEFDKCNQIQEIQQTIRAILSKKEQGHISKAEPYYESKNKCAQYLQIKGNQKQRVKQAKYQLIIVILQRLNKLRQHRQNGLKLCANVEMLGKQKLSQQDLNKLITNALQALKQIKKTNQNSHIIKKQEYKLLQNAQFVQSQINELGKKLATYINKQNQICYELERIWKLRNQSNYFKNVFLESVGMENLSESAIDSTFESVVEGLAKYEKEESEKQSNIIKIKQGIEVTANTISIFEHILGKIKTENIRRKQLLECISEIQQRHNEQRSLREVVAEIQSEIDKLQVRKNRLQKHMSEKVDQANLQDYKKIHEEMQHLGRQIKLKKQEQASVRRTIGHNSKQLYDQTIELQEEYSDIFSEIVPNYWFRDSDFTKEEAIKDLNMYLVKTFKRLAIAD